ncbi:tyrosine-type recombinase/integrase [Actinomadura miaoliensis]|uniref:Tyrosine-type recombinase/integrase n=1 Tax=Actinomadura miaoliensis TaxID=430685 RepID=A0ABP7V4T0_9ACTN
MQDPSHATAATADSTPAAATDNVISFDAIRARRRRGTTAARSVGVPPAATASTHAAGGAAAEVAPRSKPAAARRRPRAAAPTGTPLLTIVDSWELALDAAGKSPKTIRGYTDTVKALARWAASRGYPADTEGLDAADIQEFLVAERERTSIATAAAHYRHLNVFWRWIVRERERTASPNPMESVDKVTAPKKAKTYFTDEQERALLKTCSGNSFEDRRDTAILRIFMDVGVRVGGLVGIRYVPDDDKQNDVDLRRRRVRVRLKGGDELVLPLGKKAALALDRYLRVRAKHPKAAKSTYLFLGIKGRNTERMTESGVYQMIRRRGEQAGVQNAHPHRFRRTWCHNYLLNGGTLDGAMAIGGWSTYDMVKEYAGDLALERAWAMHDRLSPGDRI